MYQTEWQGVPFQSFARLSSTELADATFYTNFYYHFFQQHQKWSDLGSNWIRIKLRTVELLAERIPKEHAVLSIGCGLGFVEKSLMEKGYNNLEVTEVSEIPLNWISSIFSIEKMHIGFFPDCLENDKTYDFIYLSGVEYCFDQPQLIDFLRKIKGRLASNGTFLLISYSIIESGNDSLIPQLLAKSKDYTKLILEKLGICHRGQLWGYKRGRHEFHGAILSAGFTKITDGFLGDKTYWIQGTDN